MAVEYDKILLSGDIGSIVQAQGTVLDDLNTLGANAADSEFLVGTGAGALAWENATTAKTSIGLGNVENTQLSTWAGTTNITTLGTIATVGNITIADGGTIGQTAGPLLTFDDTSNFLEITGCHVGIGTSTPSSTNRQTNLATTTLIGHHGQLLLLDDTAQAAGVGGMLYFGGKYTDAGGYTEWGGIRGVKETGGTGNVGGGLEFLTRAHASDLGNPNALKMSINSAGIISIENTLTLKERAAAFDDTAAYGQDWVKNTTPCTRWFTDDAGNDYQLGGPTGAMMLWTTDTAPSGWILCYGQAISRTTYASLFAVISTIFGVGDGSTTFNLPDMRGRFPLGQDDMGGTPANRVTNAQADSIGGVEGAEIHTLTEAEMPAHTHSIPHQGGTVGDVGSMSAVIVGTASTGSTGSGDAHNNMSPYLTLNYIIKY